LVSELGYRKAYSIITTKQNVAEVGKRCAIMTMSRNLLYWVNGGGEIADGSVCLVIEEIIT
jgi:hypothetical protein